MDHSGPSDLERSARRSRPGPDTQPAQVVYAIEGGLASRVAVRQALVDQPSCFLLATTELDDAQLPPQELLAGYKGQGYAERGFRFLKDPRFLASSLYLKKPQPITALLMVMTVCLLVYAALEYRIRQALKDQGRTFPNDKGTLNQSTEYWYSETLRKAGQTDVSAIGVYQCRVVRFSVQPDRTVGLALLCGDPGAPHSWAVACRAESDRGASAAT